jgi:hypothetical protein
LERSGCVEVEGAWVNPWDFIPREVSARWAIESAAAFNSGDEVERQRLAAEGAHLLEEGKRRAAEHIRLHPPPKGQSADP